VGNPESADSYAHPRWRSMLVTIRPLLLLFGGTFGSALFALCAQLILARFLSVADYGRLATVLAAVNLLSPIAAFGVNWFWIQAFGREGYGGLRWIRPSYALLAITNTVSLAALAGYIVFGHGLPPEARLQIFVLASFMLLGQCAVEISSVKFQLEENFGMLALWQALSQFGRLAVAIVLVLSATRSLDAILAGYGIVGALLLGYGVLISRHFEFNRLKLAGHARPSEIAIAAPGPNFLMAAKLAFPFAFITIFYLIYFQSVILLLAWFIGPEGTALFSAALLILSAIHLVPNIIFTKFLMGRICRWAEHDAESFQAILHVSVASMIIVGTVTMIIVAMGAPYAVTMLFGAKYAGAVRLVVWLSPTIPLRFVQSAYSAMLVSESNVRRRVKYAGLSAVCSLGLNLALLPAMGLRGAAIASVASEAVLMLLNVWGVRRHVEGVRLGATFRPSQLRAAATRVLRGERGPSRV
jgi:O-antigen/teichoic acid export membrane protein